MKTLSGPRKSQWVQVALALTLLPQLGWILAAQQPPSTPLIQAESFRHYFTGFERDEKEMLGVAPPLPWDWSPALLLFVFSLRLSGLGLRFGCPEVRGS